MYHVVLGVGEDDDQARTKAEAVVDLPGPPAAVRATVVHITEDPDLDPLTVDSVRETREYLQDAGIETAVTTTDGHPTRAIAAVAHDLDADAISVGGRHRSPAGKVQLRSGAEAVILNTDLPVIVAGRRE